MLGIDPRHLPYLQGRPSLGVGDQVGLKPVLDVALQHVEAGAEIKSGIAAVGNGLLERRRRYPAPGTSREWQGLVLVADLGPTALTTVHLHIGDVVILLGDGLGDFGRLANVRPADGDRLELLPHLVDFIAAWALRGLGVPLAALERDLHSVEAVLADVGADYWHIDTGGGIPIFCQKGFSICC